MATENPTKGDLAANVCVVFILIVSAFAAGMLTANGGVPAGFPFGMNPPDGTTTVTNTTTTTTTNETTTTTTTTTVVDPPPDTQYKIHLNIYFTSGAVFSELTEGIAVLKFVDGENDASWTIVAQADSPDMVGSSDVTRHTKESTIGKSIRIEVPTLHWGYTIVVGSNWARTAEGIGDYLQTFILDATQGVECQLWLTPRWSG